MYNVVEYLQRSAHRYPNKIAFADTDKEITYKELLVRAKRVASTLVQSFEPRTPIPVFMEKSVDTIVLFLGIVYAGCFYVLLDVKQPKRRLEHIMHTLEATTLVSSLAYEKELQRCAFQGTVLDMATLENEIDEAALATIAQQALDIDPVYGIFTSGSTGVPKGVIVAHRSVIDFIDIFTQTFQIQTNDCIGNQAPWDFDVSVKDIYSTICMGATMHIIPKQFFSFPTKLIDYLIERDVTTIIWAVSALCILSTLKGFEYHVPTKIHTIMFSGEVMPIKQLRIWQRYLPNATYVNLYGPTEITCNCTYHILDKAYVEGETIPIGKAFQNERVFLLDEEDGCVHTPNVKGEICVSGTAVTLGYYNNQAQTKQAFCQNPLQNYYLETIYKTGDLGYYDDAHQLCFASRKDFQIKHMGHRIELEEVAIAMDRIHEIQRSCCIFEDHKLIAFYIGNITKKEVVKALKKELPVFMIPNVLLSIEQFPITNNGKIDRRELKNIWKEV